MDTSLADKRAKLNTQLVELGRLAVAFSGGVDSSVLLHAAHGVLGDQALGVIADSPSLPRAELAQARQVAARIGSELVELATFEGEDERYVRNSGDRCYFCKSALFETMASWCREQGIPWMAFGEITDDYADHRPGARAALEFGVVAPLSRAGFDKQDVRRYAREVGLPVADKPASACLASRLPVGTRVTRERLAQVEAAEAALHAIGLRQVRVRHLGRRARLEVGEEDLQRARSHAAEVAWALARGGFASHELAQYRAPSLRRIPAPKP